MKNEKPVSNLNESGNAPKNELGRSVSEKSEKYAVGDESDTERNEKTSVCGESASVRSSKTNDDEFGIKTELENGVRIIRLRDGVTVKVPPEERKILAIAAKVALLLIASLLSAIAQYSFVAPNNFARGGIAGIAVILNHIYPKLYLGLFNILVNIPLLIVSWIFLSRRFCLTTTGFIVLSSIMMIVMEAIDATAGGALRYVETGTPILSAVFGGAIIGVSFAMMTRIGGSQGGTDIIAAIIQKKRPDVGVSWFIFIMDSTVVLASYFVYDMTAVLLALVLTFMISIVGDKFIQGGKAAIKVEIVTRHSNEICAEIFEKIGRGVTVLDGVGMFTGKPVKVVVCVVRRREVGEIQRIVKRYPDSFSYIMPANEVYGKMNR